MKLKVAQSSKEDAANALLSGRQTIFTLNLSHIRMLATIPAFQHAYTVASLILLDSSFINRFFLSGRFADVAGSDLVAFISATGVLRKKSVLIVGNTSQLQASRIFAGSTVLVERPPFGFASVPDEIPRLVELVRRHDPDVLLIATGAPQSEVLAREMRLGGVERPSILCCGAAIDFIEGTQRRAPAAFRNAGMEWAWRLATDPPRLTRRYFADGLFLTANWTHFSRLAASRELTFGHLRILFMGQP
jgi:N-acetylglucosaminyldiphosphoundecaprenol N-acetyl-beta-D-mannosaminyltransferase